MKNIAIYLSGNYAEILKHLSDFLEEYNFFGFCQNFKTYEIIKNTPSFKHNFYLYENFNLKFNTLDFDTLREQIPFNLFETSIRDKAHFKRLSGKNQEKALLTMYSIIDEWFESTNPDPLVLPIIESMDAMLVYNIANSRNVETMCYGHARQINRSFFSDSYLETLPSFSKSITTKVEHINFANAFLNAYQLSPGKMNYANQVKELYSSFQNQDQLSYHKPINLFLRLIRNIKLKLTYEKWNQLSLFYIKFLVTIERIVIPIQKQAYLIFEKLYLKPIKKLCNINHFKLGFCNTLIINNYLSNE